ncbi:hypothetical protein SOASR032_16440 [Pragia fontium]|uniref:Pyocin activator protein PrtN n=1 Tax=Pragia fontium TaxID=82985 RepID=A0ABQ5LHJ0_9GAMM|nr:pyocin activator PrtN family protein [Pragia fontium]GKX63075.1 hypothetical protein SOASR032_16440 [Pragia fontium]
MNTVFLLMAEFETSVIPLSIIAERYLGMKPSTAYSKASSGCLLVPVFRIRASQKAPLFVHVKDLAELIDAKRVEAKNHLKQVQ